MTDASAAVTSIGSRAREAGIPLSALFEVTHACNLSCGHCYVVPDEGPELDTAEATAVLRQLAEAGTLFVTFTGGEPLLRPDILSLLREARDLDFAVRLFTNGTLIDEAIAREIAHLDLVDVGVSLYGARAASHDGVTGVRGSFEAATRAIAALGAADVRVHVKYTLMRHNLAEAEDVFDLAADLGTTVQVNTEITPRNDGDRSPLELRLDDVGRAEWLALELRQYGVRDLECEMPCSAGRDMLSVSPSGTVYPCVQLPVPLGRLRDRPLDEIWTSPEAERVRAFRLSDITRCRDCKDAPFCRPCIGLNVVENGSMKEPSTLTCETAGSRRKGAVT